MANFGDFYCGKNVVVTGAGKGKPIASFSTALLPISSLFVKSRIKVINLIGNAGLGRALATELSRLGAHVYAVTRTQADLDSLVAECPNVRPIQLDLSVWDETKRILTNNIPNSVHLLVNNAGLLEDHESHLEVLQI